MHTVLKIRPDRRRMPPSIPTAVRYARTFQSNYIQSSRLTGTKGKWNFIHPLADAVWVFFFSSKRHAQQEVVSTLRYKADSRYRQRGRRNSIRRLNAMEKERGGGCREGNLIVCQKNESDTFSIINLVISLWPTVSSSYGGCTITYTIRGLDWLCNNEGAYFCGLVHQHCKHQHILFRRRQPLPDPCFLFRSKISSFFEWFQLQRKPTFVD